MPRDEGRTGVKIKKETVGGDMSSFTLPAQIEQESMRIIGRILQEKGLDISGPERPVVMRVIHATADFDFASTMYFSEGAVERAHEAIRAGHAIITDTNMALAGISRAGLKKYGNEAVCFMADERIAKRAKEDGTTRACAAMSFASGLYPEGIYVIGNAPTALLRLEELIRSGAVRPSLVAGVPVGFVNVTESKERIYAACAEYNIPVITAGGRKGGSTVAAAIMNALIYGCG